MTQQCCPSRDFVDYFFQKDGDTYIAQLIKYRDDYQKQCTEILKDSDTYFRKDYNEFRSLLVEREKIAPTILKVENFAFDTALADVFQNLKVDVSDALDMIGKYYGFITSLQIHWKGLELESCAVIDTSVQLMATLESIVYPLFLKLTEYIGKLAEDAANASEAETPEMMMNRLHKLSEALVMEIATIGSSGVNTIGQILCTTRESLQNDSATLGTQGKHAKNCVAWALQAVAPSLLFYYLQFQLTRAPAGCGCTCNQKRPQQKAAAVKQEQKQPEPKLEPEVQKVQKPLAVEESNQSINESNQSINQSTNETQSNESLAKDEDMQERESKARMKEKEVVSESGSEASSGRSERSNASEKESVSQVQSERKVNGGDETGDFQKIETENDFVSYFFKKNGTKYVAILAQIKKKYHDRCKEMLISANHEQRQLAREYDSTVHDIRKVSPVTRAIEVGDFNFPEDVETTVKSFDINIEDKILLIKKYQEYTRGMIRHWIYRIENQQELTPETVVDIATQMMATTMALTYPIFIRSGEFIRKLSKNAEKARETFSPEQLAAKLHEFVEINALQMAAIGISALNVIARMNHISKEVLSEKRGELANQTTLAKNAVSWAMKAISPLLLLYFLRASLSFPHEEDDKPEPKVREQEEPAPQKQKREEERNVSGNRGEKHHEDPTGPTPYQDNLHGAVKYYKKPSEEKNFVHYFYAKQGQHYSTILTHMRKQYEDVVQKTMERANQEVRDKAVEFVQKYHNARKPSIPGQDIEVSDIRFEDAIGKIFQGLDIQIEVNIATIVKYFDFTKNMEEHWHYRIKKNMELDQDAVLEVSIEMMGTTVALAYPIFIKMGEYIGDMLRNSGQKSAKLSPLSLVERFKKFVTLLTTEMAAIGMSCTSTMAKVPNATRDSVSTRTSRLVNETKIADSSISWAMKAIFPVFMLYFIQYESAT